MSPRRRPERISHRTEAGQNMTIWASTRDQCLIRVAKHSHETSVMKSHATSSEILANKPFNLAPDSSIAPLVGKVYDSAPASVRKRMLACLLRPLGVLSVFGVANGIFARIMFRKGLQNGHDRLEEIQNVGVSDVTALVEYVEQLRPDSLDGLCQILSDPPLLDYSSSAEILVEELAQRIQNRMVRTAERATSIGQSIRAVSAAQFREDTI